MMGEEGKQDPRCKPETLAAQSTLEVTQFFLCTDLLVKIPYKHFSQ
jgi:hypothetical protein